MRKILNIMGVFLLLMSFVIGIIINNSVVINGKNLQILTFLSFAIFLCGMWLLIYNKNK
jgi:hypothetical protein